MPLHWLSALMMAAPLASYLGLLAFWHGRRHPTVVPGPVDFALLAFGLTGILLFGPIGQLVARLLSGNPAWFVWLGMATWTSLLILGLSRRTRNRLVVYHVEPVALERALEQALSDRNRRYHRTLSGFEDADRTSGVEVECSSRWMTASLEAFGAERDVLLGYLERRLRRGFRATVSPTSGARWIFLASATLTLLAPVAGWLVTQPQARATLRDLFHRFPGG